jgi:hypothetical protein
MILSAGGNGYVSSAGLMLGGGVGLEFLISLSGKRASEGLVLGLGLEYVSLTTTLPNTPAGGWILPFALKYGFLVGGQLDLGLGGGVALATYDVNVPSYPSGYYVTSELAVAPFAEASLRLLSSPEVDYQIALRGGEFFSQGGSYPFFGIRLDVGYYFNLPEQSGQSDGSDESDY